MGLADRDYAQADRDSVGTGQGALSGAPVTLGLIIACVAVFILDSLFHQKLSRMGWFFAPSFFRGQIWRIVTFQFLHANLGHIFFNMLSLYFFGPMVERALGSGKYLGYYLVCGMAGALTNVLLVEMEVLEAGTMVGASAGIFGVLVAAARFAPDTRVMLLFPPIPMKLRTLVWVFIGIAIYTVFTSGNNAGGEAAHLGGAVMGWALLMLPGTGRQSVATKRYQYQPKEPEWWKDLK